MPDAYYLATEEWMESLKNEISSKNKPCKHCGCRAEKEIKEVFHNNINDASINAINDLIDEGYSYESSEIQAIQLFIKKLNTYLMV